ncbi:TonB-dependent receptor plug domain-containing protein [Puniceicoccaceae bacterium K14]|nr:TonB-dependent receptor plug domain-containing protein [Puniceicoccaceae bacterium K14]
MTYNTAKLRYTASLSLALGIGSFAVAQDEPSEQNDIFELSPFEVSAEDDSGYVATNTLAGSRLNTALRDTPASISVMTKEFLNDIAANDVNDAIRYGLNAGNDIGAGDGGAGASTGNDLVGDDFNIQIRGYRDVAVTRDYFPTLLSTDMFNSDRLEVARGPNSLIFGVGGPGGIVNTSYKSAILNETSTEVGIELGSWNKNRYTLDANVPLITDKLALRLNLLHQEAEGWKDFAMDDQDRQALALTYQATENTKIKVHAEFGELVQNRVRPWNPVNGIEVWQLNGSYFVPYGTPESPWEADDGNYSQVRQASGGSPANGLEADLGAGLTFERRTAHLGTPVVYLTDGPLANKFINVGARSEGKRYYRTSFSNGVPGFNTPTFMDDETLVPRTANPTGSGAKTMRDYTQLNASIDQRIGQNLNLNLTVQSTDIDLRQNKPLGFGNIEFIYDVTTTLPTFNSDGTYNATEGGPDVDGQGTGALNFDQVITNPYVGANIISSYRPQYDLVNQKQDDIRLAASYDLDLDGAGKHTLMGFVQKSTTGYESVNYRESNVSPDRPVVSAWDHWNSSNYAGRSSHVDFFASDESLRGVPDPWSNPLQNSILYGGDTDSPAAFEAGWLAFGGNKSETEIDSMALAIQSEFFNRSLITTAGVRRDEVSIENSTVIRDDQGLWASFADAEEAQLDEGDTYSLGFVYHVPQLEWLTVYGNKSTNFQPQDGDQEFEDEDIRINREIGALTGTGIDYGFKFRFFDDKVHVSLGRYKVDQENASTGFNGNVTGYINDIWTTIQNGGPDEPTDGPLTDALNPDGHHVGGSDTRDQVSEGWEFEMTANLSENWRLSLNASKSDNEVSNLASKISAYRSKHIDEWEQWRDVEYNTGGDAGFLGDNTVGDLIDGLDGLIDFIKAGEGVSETNVRPVNANLFTAYTFHEGGFKGLTFGGGINYRGDQILGVDPATVDNPVSTTIKGGDYYLVNALISYEFTVKETDIRLQLNVDNLLQNDDKQVLASNYDQATNTLTPFYYYLEPRRYTFSANLSF